MSCQQIFLLVFLTKLPLNLLAEKICKHGSGFIDFIWLILLMAVSWKPPNNGNTNSTSIKNIRIVDKCLFKVNNEDSTKSWNIVLGYWVGTGICPQVNPFHASGMKCDIRMPVTYVRVRIRGSEVLVFTAGYWEALEHKGKLVQNGPIGLLVRRLVQNVLTAYETVSLLLTP